METLRTISSAKHEYYSLETFLRCNGKFCPSVILRHESNPLDYRSIAKLRKHIKDIGEFTFSSLEIDSFVMGILRALSENTILKSKKAHTDFCDGIIPKKYRRIFHYSERNHRDCYNMHMMSAYIMCTSYGGDLRLRNLVQHKRKE